VGGAHRTRRTVEALAYLTLVGSVIGFSAYLYALKHLPIATLSPTGSALVRRP
jgi:drug/metabolite transporter (DMT)-like permease